MTTDNPADRYTIREFPSRPRGERWSVCDETGKPVHHGSALQCAQMLGLIRRHGYSDAGPEKRKGAAA